MQLPMCQCLFVRLCLISNETTVSLHTNSNFLQRLRFLHLLSFFNLMFSCCLFVRAHSFILIVVPVLFQINFSHLRHFCTNAPHFLLFPFVQLSSFIHLLPSIHLPSLYSLSPACLCVCVRVFLYEFAFAFCTTDDSIFATIITRSFFKIPTHLYRFAVCCTWIYLHQMKRNFTISTIQNDLDLKFNWNKVEIHSFAFLHSKRVSTRLKILVIFLSFLCQFCHFRI